MAAESNHETFPEETFLEVEECDDSKETVTHPGSESTSDDTYDLDKEWAEMNRTRMIENDNFIQLVEEEKPKIEQFLAETKKNHNELDAGQKTSVVVKGLVLGISIIAAAFFLGRVVNAATATIAKAKNSKAEKTIKRQEELWSNIESKMCNLKDNIPSTVASDQVASVRRSNGLKTVNDPPSAALLYSITYDDSEGYEYKSDIPKLVESITSKLAALVAICSSLKDIKTVNDLPSETSQSLRKLKLNLLM